MKVTAGEWIKYSGELITIRDASAKRIKDINIDFKDKIVLYGAPTLGEKIVIGPTTSIRMDSTLEELLKLGVVATIGKGNRTEKAIELIKKYKAPYFVMMSGVSAYLSQFFIESEIIALKELGPEAVRKYKVKDLPLLTAIDTKGNSIFNQ